MREGEAAAAANTTTSRTAVTAAASHACEADSLEFDESSQVLQEG
jgi:hypothetical protein